MKDKTASSQAKFGQIAESQMAGESPEGRENEANEKGETWRQEKRHKRMERWQKESPIRMRKRGIRGEMHGDRKGDKKNGMKYKNGVMREEQCFRS